LGSGLLHCVALLALLYSTVYLGLMVMAFLSRDTPQGASEMRRWFGLCLGYSITLSLIIVQHECNDEVFEVPPTFTCIS
jgi:uncharacterized membrane protein YhdT